MRYEEIESNQELEEEREIDKVKGHKCHVQPIKINCDLEVTVGSKNKIIYVCPGKVQYFTASAICCSDDDVIEMEYCGDNTKCICGEVFICGCLGFYKIVKSGIIFIPRHKLSEFHDDWFPTDILCFKVKVKDKDYREDKEDKDRGDEKDDRDIKFDVVFTHSRCRDCEDGFNKRCKC